MALFCASQSCLGSIVNKPIFFVLPLILFASLQLTAAKSFAAEQNKNPNQVTTPPDISSAAPLTWRLNAQTQGAGTPNSAGVGIFWPAFKGDSSTLFVDALVNANFSDFSGYSSIINTDVAGVTPSTSTRVGYRWLNQDRSWMFGANAGYDTRSLKSGGDDTGVPITGQTTVRYQQVAIGVEANSNSWNINAYALLPVGNREQALNSVYNSGALTTYGTDVGYRMMSNLGTSLGYYYQSNNLELVNGSGLRAALTYDWTNNLSVGANLSRDQAYQTRFSVNLQYSFGKPSPSTELQKGMFESLRNRDIRVHDVATGVPDELLNEVQKGAQLEKAKTHNAADDALERARIEAVINSGKARDKLDSTSDQNVSDQVKAAFIQSQVK